MSCATDSERNATALVPHARMTRAVRALRAAASLGALVLAACATPG
ncbi:hypothetical protein BURMUCF1_1134, partial [Burkholderia multivorans ATCC BAA-247]